MKRLFILFILFFVVATYGVAQTGVLKGFVYDASNGEPMRFGMVQLEGTSFGAMTDQNGGFIINKIPNGAYTVKVTMLGYITLVDDIEVNHNTQQKRYLLQPAPQTLETVHVDAEGQRRMQETRTSVITITPKDMQMMPSIGGSPDFAQYLQILPGIVSTGDQGGQLYIRGGTPIQNMLLLDGMLIYNPFHSIGLFSVFDTEIISSADVYTGGFGAEFGGRISSVMDIKTRDGNKKRVSGKIDGNMFGARLLLEGPFVKLNEDRGTALSFIFSAKGSYLKQSSGLFYPYVKQELPYNYWDLYGKISLTTKTGTKLSLFGFNFDDQVSFSQVANYGWKNWGLGAHFLIIPGEVPMSMEGTLSYTHYEAAMNDVGYKPRETSLVGPMFKWTFNYFAGRSVFSAGVDVNIFTTKYSHPELYKDPDPDFTADIALFVKYKYNFKDILLLEPSIRLQYYASLSTATPEPRLALKYNVTKKVRLKLAGGLYSQNFVAITSDRDVVNLFYGFFSSPEKEQLAPTFLGNEMKSMLQKAQHIILGVELDLLKYTNINIEGFYKNFSQLTVPNRYKQEKDDKDFIWEKGAAYGGDITIKFDYKNFYVWCVYTLGWVKRTDEQITYAPHFDRRHNVNLLTSYQWGKKRKSWQADVRWNFGTGFPFTQTQAFLPNLGFGNISDNWMEKNEQIYIKLADLNMGRLPAYHRLDMSVKRKFFLGERNVIELSASVTNVYNYSNIFYVDRLTANVIYQLPILYSIGFAWSF
ncbi:MAG: TonB-dependent receptor [Lentimicrobiaceae bacterium]|nr:TonB-dependent receptor [Lentimicrobiaceae bacterium]